MPGTDESVPRRRFCAAWTDPSVPACSSKRVSRICPKAPLLRHVDRSVCPGLLLQRCHESVPRRRFCATWTDPSVPACSSKRVSRICPKAPLLRRVDRSVCPGLLPDPPPRAAVKSAGDLDEPTTGIGRRAGMRVRGLGRRRASLGKAGTDLHGLARSIRTLTPTPRSGST